MAASPASSSDSTGSPTIPGESGAESVDPRLAFRSALARYPAAKLAAIVRLRNLESEAARSSTLAADLTAQLDSASDIAGLLNGVSFGSRQALGLFALTETSVWPLSGLSYSLSTLGIDPRPAIVDLLELGLLALDTAPDPRAIDDFPTRIDQGPMHLMQLRAHPAVPQAVRVGRPEGTLTPALGGVGQIRESDGLEPILRLAAIWQRVGIEPLRQTGQGALYKRDLERIEEDPVLSGAISDALEPLAAMSHLWLSLARRVGLIHLDAAGERLEAAGPDFWIDNAVHLPQMIATNWMGLREWQEGEDANDENAELRLHLTFLRPPLLLWLACLQEDEWVALDDLAQQLRTTNADWDRPSSRPDMEAAAGPGRRGSNPRSRNGSQPARPARRATPAAAPSGFGICDGCGPKRRGKRDRPHGRAAHPAGPLRAGHGPSPSASSHLRSLPVCAAEFRDHRLSSRPQSAARGTAQSIRLVDQGRRGAGVEVDPGIHCAGARGRPDARADARDSDEAQPARCPPSFPTPSAAGPADASGSPSMSPRP